MTPEPVPHPGHRFPAGTIGRAVWLHHVSGLRPYDVERVLAARCVLRDRGSIRQRRLGFGADFARGLSARDGRGRAALGASTRRSSA